MSEENSQISAQSAVPDRAVYTGGGRVRMRAVGADGGLAGNQE